jgi:hypothetical protein
VPKPATRRHRRQLARIADGDHLGAGACRGIQQRGGRPGGSGPRLIKQDHRPVRQVSQRIAVGEEPVHGDRSNARGVPQLAGGPAGRSDSHDVESVLRICARQRGQ